MRMHKEWPKSACFNADFVTHKRKPGRVLSFEVDVEALPHVGLLCVHEDTIVAAALKLGIGVIDAAHVDKQVAERIELDGLRKENAELRQVIGILDGVRLNDIHKIEAEREEAEADRKRKMDPPNVKAMRPVKEASNG